MSEKIYYVYRHVRLDTNEVFYIGKGTANQKINGFRTFYSRAFSKNKRNQLWWNIVNKTGYSVEIMFQHSNENFVFEKEKEFIKLYGRMDLKNGPLANFNDGGKGSGRPLVSESTRQKRRDSSWCKGRFGSLHPFSKKLYAYKIDGSFHKEYNSMREAEKDLNVSDGSICLNLKGKVQRVKGYVFRRFYDGQKIEVNIKQPSFYDKIIVFDKNSETVLEFSSVSEASRILGIKIYRITKHLIQGSNYKNYIFKYKNPELKKDLPRMVNAFMSKIPQKRGKKIYQIDKTTDQIIKTWDSAADAVRFLTNGRSSNTSSISSCLAKKLKTALGFKWRLV